jgi:hypothetical protein
LAIPGEFIVFNLLSSEVNSLITGELVTLEIKVEF